MGACGQNVTNGVNGTNGMNGFNGTSGHDGKDGVDGRDGQNGTNGHSSLIKSVPNNTACTNGGVLFLTGIDLDDDGVLNTDEVQYSANVCNGATGATGAVGPTSTFTPIIAITPCGPTSSSYKEALLGLSGGGIFSEIITRYSDANSIRNTMLPDGYYYDTDDSACNFSVSTDAGGNRSVTWNGSSSNGSGPYHAGSAYYNATTKSWSATY